MPEGWLPRQICPQVLWGGEEQGNTFILHSQKSICLGISVPPVTAHEKHQSAVVTEIGNAQSDASGYRNTHLRTVSVSICVGYDEHIS